MTTEPQAPPEPALDGVRVLDVGGSMTGYAARVLGDLGAEVVVVEPPGGHELRHRRPFAKTAEGSISLLFAYYHAGHRSVVLDVGDDSSVGRLERLADGVDVVLISPSVRSPLAGWDRDRQVLVWAAETVVVCAVTPYGLTGPCRDWRATPFTSFAMSGLMHRIGPPEGPPTTIPGRQQWDEGGLRGALAVLAALHARPRVGGQLIDLSVHEVASQRDFLIERYDMTGMGHDWGRAVRVGVPPTGTYHVKDGIFDVAAHQLHHWAAFLKMLDYPDQLSEPALGDPMVRRELFESLTEIIADLVADRELEDLVRRGQAAGLPCGMLNTPSQFAADVQLAARRAFVPVALPGAQPVRMAGPGFRSEPAMTVPRGAVPLLTDDAGAE